MNLPLWVTVIAALFGVANVAGSTFAIYRASKNKARAQDQHDQIDELRGQVATLGTMYSAAERAVEFERRARNLDGETCRIEVAKLTGQVETLQGTVVASLVDSFKVAVATALQEVLGRSEKT